MKTSRNFRPPTVEELTDPPVDPKIMDGVMSRVEAARPVTVDLRRPFQEFS